MKIIITEEQFKDLINQEQLTNKEFVEFTKTPHFKSWFGNSKVVDQNGNPLPVYHGSPLGGIENFNVKGNSTKMIKSSGLKELGIFFTTNQTLAKKYKQERKLSPNYVDEIKTEIYKLQDHQANVRNNKEYYQIEDDIKKLKHKLNGGVYQTYLKMENPFVFDAKGKDGYNGWKELKIDIGYKTAVGFDAMEAISGHNTVYKSNYDGIIAKNIIDLHIGTDDMSPYRNLMGDVYMVFSQNQTLIEKEI